jgi:hypothetical protein
MLGETEAVAAFTPGYYVSPDQAEPVNVSSRPRKADRVDELGWELGRATLWQDGLPRLAHTLAKAASREPVCSILKSTICEYISTHCRVMSSTHIRTMLISHFAWFQAISVAV